MKNAAISELFSEMAAQIPIVPTIEEFPLEQANEVLLRIKQSKLKAAGVLKISVYRAAYACRCEQ